MEETPLGSGSPQPNRTVPIIAASVLVAALLTGGGVYTYQKNQATKTQEDLQAQIDSLKSELAIAKQAVATPTSDPTASDSSSTASSATSNTIPDSTASWKTYSNASLGFSIKYPSNLTVGYDSDTKTLAINDPSKAKPNDVAIIGADTTSMTLDQFIADLKSGLVVRDEKKTTLGGKPAYEGVDLGIINGYGLYAVANGMSYRLFSQQIARRVWPT